MPIWFMIFITICGISAILTAVRAFRDGGVKIGGGWVDLKVVVLALAIILISFALTVAGFFGFFPDQVP
jgi:hypothetical protein